MDDDFLLDEDETLDENYVGAEDEEDTDEESFEESEEDNPYLVLCSPST